MSDDVHYAEAGARWSAVLFGPCFALAGLAVEWLTAGPVFWWLWLTAAVVLGAFAALWVYGRRRFCAVLVTSEVLVQGPERLAVERITAVPDATEPPTGARVLGGGIGVPRNYDAVPVWLDDGTVVLAWARDGAALRAALRTAGRA